MTESIPAVGVVSEVPGTATTGGRVSGLVSPAHRPETVPATPLRGIALPDPPDVDVDAALFEQRRGIEASFETPPTNGEYRGPVEVRRLPQGVAGETLAFSKAARIRVGVEWIRGVQRVVIARFTRLHVDYRELTVNGTPSPEPEKLHRISRTRFLATGRPA